jgi:thiol:disulfide interchange protein
MMGTLLWLLYIFGKQLGMEAVIGAGAFLLTVGVAAWLIGRFATLSAKRRTYWFAWAGALAVTIIGFRLFLAPVLQAQEVLAGTSPAGTSTSQEGIAWRPFTTATVEELLQQHRTVFIDFTAEWCLTCKVNEKTVLADPEVIGRFASLGIVAVKADWTNRNPEITRLLSQFGRSGVPLYVIFPAASPDRPIVLPEVITKGIVLEAMDRAAK